MLARARTKQTTTGRGGGTHKKTPTSRGITKPHRAAPQGPPQALAAVLPPRRSTRTRIPKGELDRQIHWGDPAFGAWTAVNGGSSVRADLGPAAGQPVNYGSVPVLGECTAVEWLNASVFANHLWIKGHLLNDNLGGEGIAENLTPMTHTANMRYKTFETSIKRAIDACYHHGQFHDQTRWYGVRVAIDVVGLQWPGDMRPAVAAVADQVTTVATYIEKVGAAAPVAIAQPAWAPALVTGNYDCVA